MDNDRFSKLRRRDFITYSLSWAVAAQTFAAPSWDFGGQPILGFCKDLPLSNCGKLAGDLCVSAADRLPAGDPGLARDGARIWIDSPSGLLEVLQRRRIQSVDLWVRFSACGIDSDDVEHLAWSCRPSSAICSPAIGMTVPAEDGLALRLEVDGKSFETHLVTGRDPGEPKLIAGHYLLAVDPVDFHGRALDPESGPFVVLTVLPSAEAEQWEQDLDGDAEA